MTDPTNFLAHATIADLTTWTGQAAPADAERLIRRASDLIDAATTAAFEIDDTTGVPTDAVVAIALRDAVCAQVEQWIQAGEVHDISGMTHQTVSTGGLTVTVPKRLAPRAAQILHMAGLT